MFGGAILLLKLIEVLATDFLQNSTLFGELGWISVLLLFLAALLLFEYALFKNRDETVIKFFFAKNFYWIVIQLFFLSMIFTQNTASTDLRYNLLNKLLGHIAAEFLISPDAYKVGIVGTIFWAI